ncbi:hypothetical protein JCM8208_001570 [Rhodotorula glutinis]
MNVRKAITILVVLIALILAGTVAVLTTVVQYFGVDQRDVITEPEMRLYERLAATARSNLPIPDKEQKVVVGGAAPDAEPLAAPVDDEQLSPELVVTRDDAERGDESVQDLLNRLDERGWFSNSSASSTAAVEAAAEPEHKQKIPKIIHATWKTDTVPVRWAEVRQGCIDLHPDYEFKLWSDAASRAFIAEHYPWFLSTFDGYTYPIQRADVIRYFVLHHFGGIYMDLDIGCRRNLDPFLYFDVILPATIPVGVSNDLMFAERGHPFMDLVIHNLITFDHSYGTNYPTVMFSTGPMFVSAVYGMWPKDVDEGVERQVRILPRRWYGKNAPANEMQESYFDHFYGSSWHADDAGFITFLGKFGIALMYVGLGIVVLGIVRLVWNKRPAALKTPRTIGPIALPYEALPFARPGTPGSGSRPASPSHGGSSSSSGSRLGTPAGRYRDDGKPSGLFYMPVWLYPSGSSDRGTPGPRPSGGGGGASPGGGGGQQNWSQYFSNLSFVTDEAAANAHRQHEHQHGGYAPVPSFSRPPSPSNNSILHAPGSTHDGAFDGMPLHSIHAPRAHKASASTSSSSPSSPSSSHFPSSPSTTSNPPLSPNPPAYSSLRSWGTSLFRGGVVPTSFPVALGGSPSPSSSSRQPLLPVAHHTGHHGDGLEARRVHLDAAHGGGGGGLGLGGPPEYAAALAVVAPGPVSAAGSPGPLVDARGGPARAGRSTGGGGDPARQDRRSGAPAAAAAAPAGDRAVERPAGALAAGSVGRRTSFGGGGGDEESLEEQLDRELAGFDGRVGGGSRGGSGRASPALFAAREGRVGGGPGAVGVEEEVDRLLSELAPEQGDVEDERGGEGKKAE